MTDKWFILNTVYGVTCEKNNNDLFCGQKYLDGCKTYKAPSDREYISYSPTSNII